MTEKYMDLRDFQAHGYLMEVNRQFFHPLGMALVMKKDMETGNYSFTGILDSRDDPEGGIFGDGVLDLDDEAKSWEIERQRQEKETVRRKKFGWTIQPIRPDQDEPMPPWAMQRLMRSSVLWMAGLIINELSDDGNRQIDWVEIESRNGLRDVTRPEDTAMRRELDGTRVYTLKVATSKKENHSWTLIGRLWSRLGGIWSRRTWR